MKAFAPLPIDTAMPELLSALAQEATAVLVAPPGAGKTTRVPLVLAAEPWMGDKKILVLTDEYLNQGITHPGIWRASRVNGICWAMSVAVGRASHFCAWSNAKPLSNWT